LQREGKKSRKSEREGKGGDKGRKRTEKSVEKDKIKEEKGRKKREGKEWKLCLLAPPLLANPRSATSTKVILRLSHIRVD